MKNHGQSFVNGIKDGFPICLGYIAVAFSLGIAMANAGMSAFQGFLLSLVNVASAGEYADLQVIAEDAAYLEIILVTLVANMRYLLMSAALAQRFLPETPFFHRFLVGYGVTDEIFGISIGHSRHMDPYYNYGAIAIAVPGWAIGTAAGILAGNILPARIVSALSVALYGMFIAIIIPAAKENRITACVVLAGFALSYLASYVTFLNAGMKTIILTIAIAAFAAWRFPYEES